MAASSASNDSGSATSWDFGAQMRSVMAPSNGGAPMNSTLGQRFGWPSRHHSQCPQDLAGSTATSWPRVKPAILDVVAEAAAELVAGHERRLG